MKEWYLNYIIEFENHSQLVYLKSDQNFDFHQKGLDKLKKDE